MAFIPTRRSPTGSVVVEVTAATDEMHAEAIAARRRRIDVLTAQSPTHDRQAAARAYWQELVADCAAELPTLIRPTEAELAVARTFATADLEGRVRAAAELLACLPASFEPFRFGTEVAASARRSTYTVMTGQLRVAEVELAGYRERHRGVEQVVLRQRRRDLHALEDHVERLTEELARLGGQLDQLEARLVAIEGRTGERQRWLQDHHCVLAPAAAAARVLAERGVLQLAGAQAPQDHGPNGHHQADSSRITAGSTRGPA